MSILISFFPELARGLKGHAFAPPPAVCTLAVAICLSFSPRSALAQCQSGDTKFAVSIVQLVPTEKAVQEAVSLLGKSRQLIEEQVGLIQPSEVNARMSALNKAFQLAGICFEKDGDVRSIPIEFLHITNFKIQSRFHNDDPDFSKYYGKFSNGPRVLRFLILPEMDLFGRNSFVGQCGRLNIDVTASDIPGWKYYPSLPDICFMRRIAFSDPKHSLNNDYAVVHETGHWLGLAHSFDEESIDMAEDELNDAKRRMRLEQTAEAECKKLGKVPTIGYDGSADTPVQLFPAGCDPAYSCTPDGVLLKKVPEGNPMDYGALQPTCQLHNFSPGQTAILKKGAKYRQKP